jgi:DNA-binding FadR family transcriptional regulator
VHEVIREHKAIVEALSKKNVEGMKEAIRKHLTTSKLTALEGRIDQ